MTEYMLSSLGARLNALREYCNAILALQRVGACSEEKAREYIRATHKERMRLIHCIVYLRERRLTHNH